MLERCGIPRVLGAFGYKTPSGESYQYIKDYKDNIRVTVKNGGIATKDEYYPFGLQMTGLSYTSSNGNDMKYFGKELDQESGLHKYYYGWGDYYPEFGCWVAPDPALPVLMLLYAITP